MLNEDVVKNINKLNNEQDNINLEFSKKANKEDLEKLIQGGPNVAVSKDISIKNWTLEENVYTAIVEHNLVTRKVLVSLIDKFTNNNVFCSYQILDDNSIKVFNESNNELECIVVNGNSAINMISATIDDNRSTETTTYSSVKIKTLLKVLETKIDDIENLREVDNIKHITNTGEYTIENSKKGYLTNFNIQGKTFVNLWGNTISDFLLYKATLTDSRINITTQQNVPYNNFFTTNYSMYKPNTLYTIIVYVYKNTLPSTSGIYIHSTGEEKTVFGAYTEGEIVGGKTGIFKFKLTTVADVSGCNIGLRSLISNNTQAAGYKVSLNMIVLEGDYSSKCIPYFEGIQSTGQNTNNIELLTFDTSKTNIFNKNGDFKDNYILRYTGEELASELNNHKYTLNYINIESDTEYTFYNCSRNICWYDENKVYIDVPLNERQIGDSDIFYISKSPSNAKYLRVTIIKDLHQNGDRTIIIEGDKFDKKTIPCVLRSLPNGVKDEVIYKNNKYYLLKRCEEYTYYDIDNLSLSSTHTNTLQFTGMILPYGKSEDFSIQYVISDKFKGKSITNFNNQDEEGCSITKDEEFTLKIHKSKLKTPDILGLSEWIKNNPIKIVYQLSRDEQLPLVSLDMKQYDIQTELVCNTEDVKFDSTKNLGSYIEVIQNDIQSISTLLPYKRNIDLKFINEWENIWQPASITVVGSYLFVNMIVGKNTSYSTLEEAILRLPFSVRRQNYNCAVIDRSCKFIDNIIIGFAGFNMLVLSSGHNLTNKGIIVSVFVDLEV
ncbi:hypothetical protein C4R89_00655 [Clostridioides difficile]|nr:hypothetical protein [Clostridioides difficile]MDB0438046.1 hypothetical protein [Clostridioides difficile]